MDEKKKIEIVHSIIGRLPKFFLEVLSVAIVILILLFFVNQGKSIQDALPTLSLIVLIIIRTMPAYVAINTNLNNTKFNSVAFQSTCSTILKNDEFNQKDTFKFDKNKNPSIRLSNLVFSYKDNLILDNISYKFDSGKIYGIKGISGSGKTTLINLILGLLSPKMENYLFMRKNFMKI